MQIQDTDKQLQILKGYREKLEKSDVQENLFVGLLRGRLIVIFRRARACGFWRFT